MKCKFCGQEMEDTKIGEHYNYRDCAYALQARVKELEAENAASQERIEDLELRLDVYNGNMYDVVVLENERLRSELAALREQVANLKMSKTHKARVQAVKHMLEQTAFLRKCFALDVFRNYPRLRDEGLKILDGEPDDECEEEVTG
jgi:predicted RNase H-like nuclease (RuvC/YqgF family)